MNKKRILAFALCSALMTGLVSGCGSTDEAKDQQGSESNGTSQNSAAESTEIPEIEGYSLLWNDEFNGDKLDTTCWQYDPHEPGWTNSELQEYTTSEENVFTKDGVLHLKAIKTKDENGNDYYTSGKIKGQNLKDFMYGKVVVRAKVPEGQGLWPAIWMMPTDEGHYGQWPKCGEIDIMETLGHEPEKAYGTLHYGEPHGEQQGTYTLENGETFASDFHEFSVEWEPGEFRWYIDGNLYHTVNDWFTAVDGEDDKPYPAPFDQTFFVQLNLAVGGTWPGNPDATTNFDNAEFQVDYVRVYQKPEYDTNVTKPLPTFRKPLEDGNFIYNGDFSEEEALDDEDNWRFLLFNDGEGTAEIKDGELRVYPEKKGTEEYSVQIVQAELPMFKDSKYKLTFEARSDEKRVMKVCISAPTSGWVRYLNDTPVHTTDEWQTFEFDIEMLRKTDPNGRLEFNMGKFSPVKNLQIRNVRLEMTEASDEAKEILGLTDAESTASDEAAVTETAEAEVTEDAADTTEAQTEEVTESAETEAAE